MVYSSEIDCQVAFLTLIVSKNVLAVLLNKNITIMCCLNLFYVAVQNLFYYSYFMA